MSVEVAISVGVRVASGRLVAVTAGVGERVTCVSRALDLFALFNRTITKGTEIRAIISTSIAISTHSTVGTLGGVAGAGTGR